MQIFLILLQIYLYGTTIAPTTKKGNVITELRKNRNIWKHTVELKPNKAIEESQFKRRFFFDILRLLQNHGLKEVFFFTF